jgi:hypothetical protein
MGLYYSADGRWLVRGEVACKRYDIAVALTGAKGSADARRRLARVWAEMWGEQEFCEWAILKLEG